MRTEGEVTKASRYVEVMAKLAQSNSEINETLSSEDLRLLRISSNRMIEVLEWVLGEDNKFGALVQRFSEPDQPETRHFRHRRRSKD